MYLEHVMESNSQLIKQTIELHQKNKIPPNTWVIDLDQIAANAKILGETASQNKLITYLMSKQHNRNPYINSVAISQGLHKIVAVDVQGALQCGRYNIPVGHVGHLEQIPRIFIPYILKLNPEVITVYSINQARWINEGAKLKEKIQNIMVRVITDGDVLFDGQEGGIEERELDIFAHQVKKLSNIELIGVTSFPCVRYNETKDDQIKSTQNLETILRAAANLNQMGFSITQINTPGNTNSELMPELRKLGATHVEPGNALLGTTPSNAFRNDCAEKTAFIYLTEISHFYKERAYAYGGGVYHTNYSDHINALIGSTWDEARKNKIRYNFDVVQDIDYHMQFVPNPDLNQTCKIGDSVILAYRTQMQMTRSYILPISGLSGDRELKLHYLFDHANNALDHDFNPVSSERVVKDIEKLIKTYE
ncbi:alanine racemase [Candidatus Lokiarchaeum ossiferum]|uniref:alanine racemase n=1 Tax=Candidatus Lokiarchaeum ossiferum TaxID=2951803 RepID=UPI00352D5C31